MLRGKRNERVYSDKSGASPRNPGLAGADAHGGWKHAAPIFDLRPLLERPNWRGAILAPNGGKMPPLPV